MNYIENIYICLAAPLILAILCMRREGRRSLIFVVAGMTTCLFSAYVSTFLAGVTGVSLTNASHEISPVVEEIMKSLPILFFLLIFEPDKKTAVAGVVLIAVGFATFENVCFLTSYGTSDLLRLLIRGFGTGAMHVVCGMAVALGLLFLWDRVYLRVAGGIGLLGIVIVFHAVFNIFVNQTGVVFWIGSAVPLALVVAYVTVLQKRIRLE